MIHPARVADTHQLMRGVVLLLVVMMAGLTCTNIKIRSGTTKARRKCVLNVGELALSTGARRAD